MNVPTLYSSLTTSNLISGRSMIMVTTQQYALMALEAYYDSPRNIAVDGQHFEAKYSSADYSMELNSSGFFATSYEIGTDIVIAFRGSDSPIDDMADLATNAVV